MNVLIACEESQEVCKAFRALGHNASADDFEEKAHALYEICKELGAYDD